MISTPQEMRELSYELTSSVWTLAAIGALFEGGLVPLLREPRTLDDLAAACRGLPRSRLERTLGVAAAVGAVVVADGRYRLADGVVPFAQPLMHASLQGEIRTYLMQALAFLDASGGSSPYAGWGHTNAALLQSQGDASGGFPPMFKAGMVPKLGDLGARLEREGARFLDVGVGVGSLAISMCRVWPGLRVVGLDTRDAPLDIARGNIARAGLESRIELRKLGVEELRDQGAFAFAWLPAFFIDAAALPAAVARVHASIEPGGWLAIPLLGAGSTDKTRAVTALVNDTWGGPMLTPAEAEALCREAGFTEVRTISMSPTAPSLILGKRAD